MKTMADLDAVHLGLDENEADIAEELQDFDESFDTRSEASESGSDSSTSISSVSTAPSSIAEKRKSKPKEKAIRNAGKKAGNKRSKSPPSATANGKNATKKKRTTQKAEDTAAVSSQNEKSSNDIVKKSRKKSAGGSSNDVVTAAAVDNVTGNKSDASDVEAKPAPQFDSDTESEDSDSAANIKRNGRKNIITAATRSSSPEKKSNSASKGTTYDYMTKLNYLFRDSRFFLIKSNNADNVHLSKTKNVWATLPQNDANLNQAFKESRNVLLIFSVNESGKFAGFARMSAQSRRDIPQVAWVLPPSISAKALGGVIELDWICRKELSFNCTSHLYNSWNEGKPVKIGRDGQELEPKVGAELCRLFPEDEKVELTPILRKSKETAKTMREKGIRMVYKAPRSLSSRGARGGGGGGPIRNRRYASGPHRPYKMPSLSAAPGHYKRSSSPYRSRLGGSSGSSRAGGGDIMPPWERYMTSAAAAEAYVADYMRTMHGQLPPLPFVPPFAQMPLSTSGSGGIPPPGAPSSMYEQLQQPVRYYDGPPDYPPPLPDYPPPSQPIRPPPPGFDKAPSYEDFAAWKNAGLPMPGAIPPGFPGFSNSSLSGSNGAPQINSGSGSFAGGANAGNASNSAGGPSPYRSRDNLNLNRSRERAGVRDYHRGGGVSSRSSGGDRERHFRAGGNDRGGHRTSYRDGRR